MKYSHNPIQKEFIYGSFVYRYELVKQDRKSLSLTVAPDLQLCVKCPIEATEERIELFLKRKWFWLEKQLSFFGKLQRKVYEKEYRSGESFHYLGKQHRLKVEKSDDNKVSLLRGVLLVSSIKDTSDGLYIKKLLDIWYQERINDIFNERFEEINKRFNYKEIPVLKIRDMRRRWGSFLNTNQIALNPKLIHTPKECIDYVITHELCHVKYKNHDKKFYSLLDEKYPRWEKVKDKLEIMGAFLHT